VQSPSPEPLVPERVQRFYRGGRLIERMHGREGEDGDLPEEWIGSITAPGLSRLADGKLLRDAIADDPEAWLGRSHLERYGLSTGLLVKLLDSAERLPVHAHLDRPFAKNRLDSPFGKTEAWIVLATRDESAEVWVGQRESVDRVAYRELVERQDSEAMLGLLHRLTVSAGDVVFVPAGRPHAIGAGALIAELQEPTDFSILVEWEGFPIRGEAAHLGLGWEVALEALDLEAREPVLGLPPEARRFFWADEETDAPGRFCVLVVLDGDGSVAGARARAGDGFAVPAACNDLDVEGELRVLRCLAPEP
jgi:mannose-6-phosphate isomerase